MRPQGRGSEYAGDSGRIRAPEDTPTGETNSVRKGTIMDKTMADQIRADIKRLIAEVTEREPDEISDTALFADELGVDSLMAMEVMVAVDKKYKINIPEDEFAKIRNVNDTVEVVQRHMGGAVATA